MWRRRLLTPWLPANQRGAVPVESTFAIVLLMLLSLGVIQVALALYARNIVMSSAHEGARAAIERGTDEATAAAIARHTVRQATGSLVDDLDVDVNAVTRSGELHVTVVVAGIVSDLGPVPFPITLTSKATASTALGR